MESDDLAADTTRTNRNGKSGDQCEDDGSKVTIPGSQNMAQMGTNPSHITGQTPQIDRS